MSEPRSFATSRTLWQRANQVMPAGVSSQFRRFHKPVPLYFTRGFGSRVVDADANEYVDYTLGWGPMILGHSHPALVKAVCEQMALCQTFGAQHALEPKVAERITSLCPGSERVVFQTTGTEAVQMALRLARAHTKRPLIIRFEGHYHGWLDSVLAKPNPHGPKGQPLPTSEGQAPGALADCLCLPWNDLAVVEQALHEHRGQVAAVITEALAANGGGVWPGKGYLAGLRSLCDKAGALLIFDEVITGFRVALGGAAQLFGVRPDLAVYGKALASGFALSAVGGSAHVLDLVAEGRTFQAGTLNGQPVALAAAACTLNELSRDNGAALVRIEHLGERLQLGLRSVFAEADVPLQTSGHGSVFWTFIAPAPLGSPAALSRHDGTLYARFAERLLNEGVLVMQTGRWYVSAAHSESDIDATVHAARRVLCSMRADGLTLGASAH